MSSHHSRGPIISNPYTYSSRKHSSSARGAPRTSAYKRSPRAGFIGSIWRKIQKFLRTILSYFKAHPFKIVLPIVMALISGGALTAVAAKVGLGSLGKNIENLVGAGSSVKGGYDAWYGSQNVANAASGFDSSGLVKGALKVAAGFI